LAKDTYDRLELSGEALRRESGFDEQDAPTKDELEQQILKILARQPQNGFTALDEILGRAIVRAAQEKIASEEQEITDDSNADEATADEKRSTPDTMEDAREATAENQYAEKQYAKLRRMVEQSELPHYVRINAFGDDVLMHPEGCKEHLFSCPFTAAAQYSEIIAKPGTTATYHVTLDSTGRLCYGPITTESLHTHRMHTKLSV
jgi:hypothetical protein